MTKNLPVLFRRLCITFFVFCNYASVQAQKIDASIAAYADAYMPERMYLHYDKYAYSAGETVWFKAYMMTELMPAYDSKTLYVDWVDDKGKLLKHVVCPLVKAATNGQFEIPLDYKGNSIQVKAYTRWMLNFDSTFLYTKTIPVISAERKSTNANKAVIPSIHFFAESGDAVAGIQTKIAFKATDQWGKPVAVTGYVMNNNGDIEDSIRTVHDGMGYFSLLPKAGVNYTAQWKAADGVQHTSNLPAIKTSGTILQMGLPVDKRSFLINCSADIAASTDSLHVVGTMYQRQVFRISKSSASLPIKGVLATQDLPSGILTITVFNKDLVALAERIIFINNDEYKAESVINIQQQQVTKRGKNEMTITVPDSIASTLSVAVTDALIDSDTSTNIYSHLLLASELKGNINNAAYYFSNNTDATKQHLDLVMLTNGWRRYAWKEVFKNILPEPKFVRDTSFITLSGKVFGVQKGKQINPNAMVSLVVAEKDGPGRLIMLPVKPNGTFNDPSIVVFDTLQIFYQFQKGKELLFSTIQFMTDQLPGSPFHKFAYTDSFWLASAASARQLNLAGEANSIAEMLRIKTLENITVKSKIKKPIQLLDEKYTQGLFKFGDAVQMDLREDPFADAAINIFYYLQGRVAGLLVYPSVAKGQTSLSWRGDPPKLYVDEAPIDVETVSSINIRDIAYVKAFRPPAVGFNAPGGVIAIYTRRGDDFKTRKSRDGFVDNKVVGYTQIIQFYSPDYAVPQPNDDQKDLRTTLYWNPALLTSEQKKDVSFSFYNNDVSNAFRVIVEGMTADGRLIHTEKIIR